MGTKIQTKNKRKMYIKNLIIINSLMTIVTNMRNPVGHRLGLEVVVHGGKSHVDIKFFN